MRFADPIFSNYKRIMVDKVFQQSIVNTFLYLIIQVPIMLVLAILLAQLLNNKDLKFKGFFRTCVFLPCATSLVSYSLIFRSMFATDGLINSILIKLGILTTGYNFLEYLDYLQNSSFPYTLELKDQPDEIRNYLEGLYNTIVIKDIMNRKKITDPIMLKSILKFVFDSIGSPLSSKKIADTMTSAGRKIDARTVEKYLAALTESYIVYQAKRYSIKGKQHLKTLEKYYVVDIGLRFMLIGSRQPDAGHILENIVYLELLRRGYDVYVGKVDEFEVDFVAQNSKGTKYFQVALSVRDEKTLARELRPLQAIKDHYPKVILTMDDDPEVHYDGIRRINARDWLLGLTD